MLYSILIYGSVADWTEQQEAAVLDRHAALRERLAREGRLGPVMRLEPGKAGADELLGLYVVDCGNDDEAASIARALHFEGARFDIRPIAAYLPGNLPPTKTPR
jgi:hypothetical protein